MQQTTPDSIGFPAGYSVEVDPEFPADGMWTDQVVHLHREGACAGGDDIRTTWGPPLIARVRPPDSAPWIAMAETAGGHSFTTLVPGPSANQLIVVNQGSAYVCEVARPTEYVPIRPMPIVEVLALPILSLALLLTFTDLVAIDASGLFWITDRLVLDELRVVSASPGAITVAGYSTEGVDRQLTVDAATGLVTSGAYLSGADGRPRHWRRPA